MNVQPSGSHAPYSAYQEQDNTSTNTNAFRNSRSANADVRENTETKSDPKAPQDTLSQMRRLNSVINMEKKQAKASKLNEMKVEYAKKRQDFISGKGENETSLDDLEKDYREIVRIEGENREKSIDRDRGRLDEMKSPSNPAGDQFMEQKRIQRDDKYREHACLAKEVSELTAKRDALRRDIEAGRVGREEGIDQLEALDRDVTQKARLRDQRYEEYGNQWKEVHDLEVPAPADA